MVTPARFIVSLAVVLFASRTGSAQTETAPAAARPPQVFNGMFGPTPAELRRPVRIDLTCSIYDAPDDNMVLVSNLDRSDQLYTGAVATLAVSRQKPHSQLAINLSSAGRYYQEIGQTVTMRHSASVGFDASLGRSVRLQLWNSAGFSPLYQVDFGPSAGALWGPELHAPIDNFAVSRQRAMQYSSLIGLTQRYSDKTDLTLNYRGHYTQVFGAPDFYTQQAGFQFNHALTRDFGVRVGYTNGVSTPYDDPSVVSEPIRNNDIDLGIVYGRSFKPSARTSFNFSTGSTIVSAREGRTFRVTGMGRLVRRLSPRWSANLSFDRGLQVPDGATRPFFADTVGAALTGYFSRRVILNAHPSYARGVVGFVGPTNSYNSYSSTTRLDIALNRRFALFTEHVFYRYQFANRLGLPSQLASGVNRQSVRVGLTLWTPLAR